MKIKLLGKGSLCTFICHFLKVVFGIYILICPLEYLGILPYCINQNAAFSNHFNYIYVDNFIIKVFNQQGAEMLNNYVNNYSALNIPIVIINVFKLYYLIKIFENFSNGKIFEIENFKRTKIIGILTIVGALGENFAKYLAALTLNNMTLGAISLQAHFKVFDSRYLVGLIILVAGGVFKKAIEIKEEQDLTV